MTYYRCEMCHINLEWYDGPVLASENLVRRLRRLYRTERSKARDTVRKVESPFGETMRDLTIEEGMSNVLGLYVANHVELARKRVKAIQIAVTKSKWQVSTLPDQVRRATRQSYPWNRFLPEADKLLHQIDPDEILHIPPRLPRSASSEYLQIVLAYPATFGDWKHGVQHGRIERSSGPLERFLVHATLPHVSDAAYHNWPIYQIQLRSLLHDVGCTYATRNPIIEPLRARQFQVLAFESIKVMGK